MVARNMRNYLENGVISHSVNFPTVDMPRNTPFRLTIVNQNVPNMVGQISTCLANASLNIADLLNKSLGELAYTIVDLDAPVTAKLIAEIEAIEGVVRVRSLEKV
jgi:D-3-phosphoglycerate dehydrogenase